MLWVDVLNRAVGWSNFETAQAVARSAGAKLAAAEHGRLVADAALLRRAFATSHLQRTLVTADEQALLQWLQAVTLRFADRPDCGRPTTPVLLPIRRGAALPQPFEQQLSAALLQFFTTVSEGEVFASVHRCHGVNKNKDGSMLLSEELETAFAARAGLEDLLQASAAGSSWTQCEILIFSERGRHFCSKACSNATFAARKALADPRYFAAKQERYRSKQQAATRQKPAAAPEGAFVYMD